MMKRLLCGLMILLLLCCCAPAGWAEEVEEPIAEAEYPAIRIDPSTGEAWDLGGRTVCIYDWWTGSTWQESEPYDEWSQAQYDYRTWIEETYNCTVITGTGGDWGSIAQSVADFAGDPDGTLRIYMIPADFVSGYIGEGVFADWSKSSAIRLSDSKWNSAVTRFMTVSGQVLGVYPGYSEPRQVLFFNKRVLTEAGIDWNDLYDMQAAGTWTFSAFEDLLAKIQRDTDGDEVLDVFGMTGNRDDFLRIAVFSNGGSFFDLDSNGMLSVTAGNEKSRSALAWGRDIWNIYSYKRQEDDSWDYYKAAWLRGICGFYVAQAYSGFNDYSEMSGMDDPWGCVAFPKGPQGTRYVTIVSNNLTVIPNAYDADTLSKITLIYDLWTDSTPGYFSGDEWIGNKYEYTDERAVNETYAMLRDPEHGVVDMVSRLGSVNDVEGMGLLWPLDEEMDVGDMIDAVSADWEGMVQEYNRAIDPYYGYDVLFIPENVTVIEAEAFMGTAEQYVVIPDGCVSIGSRAFADSPNLLIVEVPLGIEEIAADAFDGCEVEIIYR